LVIPNNQKIMVSRFRANGADMSCYVALYWDKGGAQEKVIASTKGDIDLLFDSTNVDIQFIGDGSKKISIVIINDNATLSPLVGGAVEVTNLG
jgi:hypothetical protein